MDDDPKRQRGLLPSGLRDGGSLGPDWEGIVMSIWLAAVAMVFGALFLQVSIGTARELELLWLAAPLIALYTVLFTVLCVRLIASALSDRSERFVAGLLTPLRAAGKAASVPLWVGTLASFAVWYFAWGTQAEARVVLYLAIVLAAVTAVVAWRKLAQAERAS